MRVGAIALAVLVLPVVTAFAWVGWIAAGERAGINPFSAPPFRNSAEAAAAGDPAGMMRLIRMGDDPTRVHRICCELISSQVQYATTLEAAIWSRRIESIHLLDREGAIIGADERRQLACLAADLDMPDASAYLAPGHTCVRGAAIEQVMARTREVNGTDE